MKTIANTTRNNRLSEQADQATPIDELSAQERQLLTRINLSSCIYLSWHKRR